MIESDVYSDQEKSSHEDSSYNVVSSEQPPAVCLLSDLHYVKTLKKSSNSEISLWEHISGDEIRVFYFKKNNSGSVGPALEAVSAGFSALIAPEYTAETWAVYDDFQRYAGVISAEIPDFKPSSEDGLTDKDLAPSPLDDVPIQVLEKYYAEYCLLHNELQTLTRREKKIDRDRPARIAVLEAELSDPDGRDEEDITDDFRAIAAAKRAIQRQTREIRLKLDNLYSDMMSSWSVTEAHFETYRVLRGHAHACCAAILAHDADFHRNNHTKFGMRFDLDMSLWDEMYEFKVSNLKHFRVPTPDMFYLSRHDIEHFPNISGQRRFYWPTRTIFFLSTEAFRKAGAYFGFRENAYRDSEVLRYSRLETNRIFAWHKYAVMLRYILTTPEMYHRIILQHLPDDNCLRHLINALLSTVSAQLEWMNGVLISIPEFRDFIREYGQAEMEKFVQSLPPEQQNYADIISDMFIFLQEKSKDYRAEEKDDGFYIPENDQDVFLDEMENWEYLRAAGVDGDLFMMQGTTILDILDIKKITIDKMEKHISETGYSIRGALGFFGSNISVARGIIEYCTGPEMETGSPDLNISASANLYRVLEGHINTLYAGDSLRRILEELLMSLEGSLEHRQNLPFVPST